MLWDSFLFGGWQSITSARDSSSTEWVPCLQAEPGPGFLMSLVICNDQGSGLQIMNLWAFLQAQQQTWPYSSSGSFQLFCTLKRGERRGLGDWLGECSSL